MPYASNAELPPAVKNALPAAAQSVFRNVVNSQEERGLSIERAFASAWSALKTQGWTKQGDTWRKVEKVLKFDTERQYVFGWASVAIAKDGNAGGRRWTGGEESTRRTWEEAALSVRSSITASRCVMHKGESVGHHSSNSSRMGDA